MASQDSEQAFRNLIHTVTKDDPKTKLTPEAITRLTEKLGEIVGYDAANDFTAKRNERGELVNEEGLPIIDITEPAEPETTEDGSFVPHPEPLVPLTNLSEPVRARLREKRNAILDALEKEEGDEEERERQKEREELQGLARKRESDKERQKSAKELQKKMGKALLRSVAESKEQAAKALQEQQLKDEQEEARRKNASPFKKKNVTFADEAELFSPKKEREDWGDLIPGKIQPTKRPTLLTETSTQETMKMNVVERRPTRTAAPPTPIRSTQQERDSDDESDGGYDASSPPESDQESDNELEKETDFDYANLQRQVQLEYARMRSTIGQDAASLIHSSHEAPSGETQTENNIGISKGDSSKPAISQYRANRLLFAYGTTNPAASSGSASDFIVPAASARTMRNAIRTGKLDSDGKLVGSEDDSASEAEGETMQEVLELLKRGEVYNLGPNGEPIYVHPQDDQTSSSPGPGSSSSSSKHTEIAKALGLTDDKKLPPLSTKTPMSKFKLSSRGGIATPPLSESATPINDVGRSSPKPSTPLTGSSTAPSTPSDLPVPHQSGTTSATTPMIIDSPSFAPPSASASRSTVAATIAPASSGGDRLNPDAPALPLDHPAFSMIVESPSFPRPGAAGAPSSQSNGGVPSLIPPGPMPGQVVERKTTRPTRPPTLMTSSVRESKPMASTVKEARPVAPTVRACKPPQAAVRMSAVGEVEATDGAAAEQPSKRVSRFKMERAQ